MGLDPNFILQLVMQKRQREEGDAQRKAEQEAQFGDMLFESIAKQGGDVRKAAGLLPNYPTHRLDAWEVFSKLTKQQQKTQEQQKKTQEVLSGGAPTNAAFPIQPGALQEQPQREDVLESLRSVEQGITGRQTQPFEPFSEQTLSAFSAIDAAAQASSAAARQEISAGRRAAAKESAELVAQKFGDEESRRKEFTSLPQVKDYITQRNAYGRVVASAREPSPAGDLALIFNFMKVLDPGSVVRESEFAQAASSGAFGQRVQAAAERIVSGKRLTAEQRNDFVKRGRMIFEQSSKDHKFLEKQFKSLAKREGLNPNAVVLDFSPRIRRPAEIPAPPPEAPEGSEFLDFDKKGNAIFIDPDGRRFVVE